MYVVLVDFVLTAEFSKAFHDRVKRQADDSLRLEQACQVFDVCVDPDDSARVMLYEVYSDRGAFEAHLASNHFKAFDADVRDWVVAKKVAFFERI